jgi:hypothetical protein
MSEAQKKEEEIIREKEQAFYAASVEAWYLTRLEHDKSLLILSSGGIGLLITLITTKGVDSIVLLALNVAALIFFVVCIISILFIFSGNSTYIVNIIKENKKHDPRLRVLDNVAKYSFIIAIILSLLIGISTAANSLKHEEVFMSKETKNDNASKLFKGSFNDADKLKPATSELLKKSFDGAGDLRPAPPTNTETSTSGSDQGQGQGGGTSQDKGKK